MVENILLVASQVLVLFILIGLGFVCNKVKLFNNESVGSLSNFVLYVVSPCVIINSYMRDFDKQMLGGLFMTLMVAFLSFAISIIISYLLVRDTDKRREKVLRFGTVFSNCGYMSLPLQSALLGEEGVFYGATYIVVFKIVLWTWGIIMMSGDSKNISFKKLIFNPGILGTIVGFLIFIFSLKVPFVISEPIKYLAALNTPIPMIIVGFHLADSSLKIKGVSAYMAVFLRLVFLPLVTLLILYLCNIKGVVMLSCVIASSAPFAAITTMFSQKFDGDTALSATGVALTTVLSVITMPVIVGVAAMVS